VVNMSFTLLGSERSRFVFKFGSGFGVPGSVRQMCLRLAVEPEPRTWNLEHRTEHEHEPSTENPEV